VAVKSIKRVEIVPHPPPLPFKGRGDPHGPRRSMNTSEIPET